MAIGTQRQATRIIAAVKSRDAKGKLDKIITTRETPQVTKAPPSTSSPANWRRLTGDFEEKNSS